MKKIKIELTTFLSYSDETEIYEVEIEDTMAEQLEALAQGQNLTEDEIREDLPEVFSELKRKALRRACDLLVIDGWENFQEEGCSKDLYEIYKDSYFEGDYDEWKKAEEEKMSKMTISDKAYYLQDKYGCDFDMVDKCYEFEFVPEAKNMSEITLKPVTFCGLSIQIPEIWNVTTESYTEPDGRECAMIDISANDGDPRSIIISYGPMPEGSDAIMEAGDTYEEVVGEIGPDVEDDPICEYDFLGTTGYGFEVPTEDGLACNFICAEIGSESEERSHLFTILTTGRTFEEIDELLDLVEQNISFN